MAEQKTETKLATPKETAVATFDDTLLSGGTGLEETTTEDFAIPYKVIHRKLINKKVNTWRGLK